MKVLLKHEQLPLPKLEAPAATRTSPSESSSPSSALLSDRTSHWQASPEAQPRLPDGIYIPPGTTGMQGRRDDAVVPKEVIVDVKQCKCTTRLQQKQLKLAGRRKPPEILHKTTNCSRPVRRNDFPTCRRRGGYRPSWRIWHTDSCLATTKLIHPPCMQGFRRQLRCSYGWYNGPGAARTRRRTTSPTEL